MNIEGRVIKNLGIISGTSASGSTWRKLEFLVEQFGQYPKNVLIQVMGDKAEAMNSEATVGREVDVSVNVESREYNGKYFTQVTAWKINGYVPLTDRQTYGPPAAKPSAAQPTPSVGTNTGTGILPEEDDSLPF